MKKLLFGLGLISAFGLAAMATPVNAEEVIEDTPIVEVEEATTEEAPIVEDEAANEEQEAIDTQEVVSVEEVITKLQDTYNVVIAFLVGIVGADLLVALYVIGKLLLKYLSKHKEQLAKDKESEAFLNKVEDIVTKQTDAIYNKLSEDDKIKAKEKEAAASEYEERLKAIVENAKVSE